jgi:hypothetical protein
VLTPRPVCTPAAHQAAFNQSYQLGQGLERLRYLEPYTSHLHNTAPPHRSYLSQLQSRWPEVRRSLSVWDVQSLFRAVDW